MIGKIIGAVAGQQLARHASGISGPGGALLGLGATAVARRLGPMGLVAAAVGGYAVKKWLDKRPGAAPNPPPQTDHLG